MAKQRLSNTFYIEVENWGEWELVAKPVFNTIDFAKEYGEEQFPQNNWRVIGRNSQSSAVVYTHNGLEVMVGTASQELNRFKSFDRWMDRFTQDREKKRAKILAAERVRQTFKERQQRFEGFEYITPAPVELRVAHILEEGTFVQQEEHLPKINWLKEGF